MFGTSDNDSLTGVSAYVDVLHGGAGNDTLTALGDGDTLDGSTGNDTLTAGGNGNTLDGGAGDDVLAESGTLTGIGATYIGGTGNDTLTGAFASDTYLFNLGDGRDTINEYSSAYANTDVLQFSAGINPSDVTPVRSGLDLVLKVGALGADQITVVGWFRQLRLSPGRTGEVCRWHRMDHTPSSPRGPSKSSAPVAMTA